MEATLRRTAAFAHGELRILFLTLADQAAEMARKLESIER
jgi:hypothetical protein